MTMAGAERREREERRAAKRERAAERPKQPWRLEPSETGLKEKIWDAHMYGGRYTSAPIPQIWGGAPQIGHRVGPFAKAYASASSLSGSKYSLAPHSLAQQQRSSTAIGLGHSSSSLVSTRPGSSSADFLIASLASNATLVRSSSEYSIRPMHAGSLKKSPSFTQTQNGKDVRNEQVTFGGPPTLLR